MRQEVASDDEFGPDLLCDPSFVPCREEHCPRGDLHAAHEIKSGTRGPRHLDRCPRCQGSVVVTQTKLDGRRAHEIRATCSTCDWTFCNKARIK